MADTAADLRHTLTRAGLDEADVDRLVANLAGRSPPSRASVVWSKPI